MTQAPQTKSHAERLKAGQEMLAQRSEELQQMIELWVRLEDEWRAEPGNADKCPLGGCPEYAIVRCRRCALESYAGKGK